MEKSENDASNVSQVLFKHRSDERNKNPALSGLHNPRRPHRRTVSVGSPAEQSAHADTDGDESDHLAFLLLVEVEDLHPQHLRLLDPDLRVGAEPHLTRAGGGGAKGGGGGIRVQLRPQAGRHRIQNEVIE